MPKEYNVTMKTCDKDNLDFICFSCHRSVLPFNNDTINESFDIRNKIILLLSFIFQKINLSKV